MMGSVGAEFKGGETSRYSTHTEADDRRNLYEDCIEAQ